MTLPTIFPPASLPVFLAAGHAIDLADAYAGVPRARGHGRVRALCTAPPRTVDVAWLLNAAQIAELDAWFEEALLVGERHFTAYVANQGPGQLYWDAVWEAPYNSEPIAATGGLRWRVTGRIRLSGEGQAERTPSGAIAAEVGIALLAVAAIISTATPLAAEITIALLPASSLQAEISIPLLATLTPLATEISIPLLGSATFGAGGGGGGGLVTGIALALPVSVFSITGSPALDGGTLTGAFTTQSANQVFAGPVSGGAGTPTFRALVAADLPALSALLDLVFGSSQGNILTRNATVWTVLAPGTAGYLLKTGGAGANVSWVAPGSGGIGSYSFTVGSSFPGSPTDGDWFFHLTTRRLYSRLNDGGGSAWVAFA